MESERESGRFSIVGIELTEQEKAWIKNLVEGTEENNGKEEVEEGREVEKGGFQKTGTDK